MLMTWSRPVAPMSPAGSFSRLGYPATRNRKGALNCGLNGLCLAFLQHTIAHQMCDPRLWTCPTPRRWCPPPSCCPRWSCHPVGPSTARTAHPSWSSQSLALLPRTPQVGRRSCVCVHICSCFGGRLDPLQKGAFTTWGPTPTPPPILA